MTPRCCMCRGRENLVPADDPFPPDTWRCVDRAACRHRVRAIVQAHRDLADTLAQ